MAEEGSGGTRTSSVRFDSRRSRVSFVFDDDAREKGRKDDETHEDLLTSLLPSLRDERRVSVQAFVHDDSETPPIAGETVAESSNDWKERKRIVSVPSRRGRRERNRVEGRAETYLRDSCNYEEEVSPKMGRVSGVSRFSSTPQLVPQPLATREAK